MAADMHPEHDAAVSAYSLQMALSQLARQPSRGSTSQSSQRAYRIEKPKSIHNSPRTTMERRTTTSGTKRYATLDDHFNMMFGNTGDENAVEDDYRESARPVSWHPSSSQFHVPSRLSVQEPNWSGLSPTSARNSTYGSDYYSLSPHRQTPAIPSISRPVKRGSDSSESSQQASRHSFAMSSYSTPSTEPWYLQEWARKTQAQSTPSERVSSDFLPIQRPSVDQDGDSSMEEEEEEPKELVGMGLYDAPEVSLGWSSLEGTGKGLKLEETWQPPENDDNDDNDENEDDASSDGGSVEELPVKEEPQPLPLPSKPKLTPSMEGQSFFFDEEESYTKEWWYSQLKQPTVRDTGLGYDWL